MTIHCVLQCKARSHSRPALGGGGGGGRGSRAPPRDAALPRGPSSRKPVCRSSLSLAYTCPLRAGTAEQPPHFQALPALGHRTPPWSLGHLTPWACSRGPLPTEACASSPHLCPQPAGLIVLSLCPCHPHSHPCLLRALQTRPNPSTDHTRPLTHSLSVCLLDDAVSIHPPAHTSPCQPGLALWGA